MMNIDQILELDEDDFDEELKEAFLDLSRFRPFFDPRVIRRSAEVLRTLRDEVDGQLLRYGNGKSDDPTWESRTKGFRGVVSSRLHAVQYRIRDMDRELAAVAGGTQAVRAWKRFAHQLAEAIDASEHEATVNKLDTLMAPFGDLTAGEWLDRRLEKNPERTGANA